MLLQSNLLRWSAVLVLATVIVVAIRSQVNAQTPESLQSVTDSSTVADWSGIGGCARCQFGSMTKSEVCAPIMKSGSNIFYLKSTSQQKREPCMHMASLACSDSPQRLTVKASFLADTNGRKWLDVAQFTLLEPWGKDCAKSRCPILSEPGASNAVPVIPSSKDLIPINKLDLDNWGKTLWHEARNSWSQTVKPLLDKHLGQ